MSLHAAAKHISTKGRGSDSMLVHMTPGEVHGLQALAKANGGSLSINPHTGLVEAGFLSKILPVVAAAAATYFTAGAAAPALEAALAGTAGAGMGGILAGAGSGALINGGMAAIQGKNVGEAAVSGGLGGAISGGLGAYGGAPDLTNGAFMPSGTPPVSTASSIPDYSSFAYQNPPSPTALPPVATPPIPSPNAAQLVDNSIYGGQGMSPTAALTQNAGQAAQPAVANAVNAAPKVDPYEAQGLMQNARNAGTALNPGSMPKPDLLSGNYYQGLGEGGVDTAQKLGIQALPVMSMLDDQKPLVPVAEEPSRLKRISPNFRAQEAVKPDPYYKAKYAAGGGLMDLAPNGMAVGGVSTLPPQTNFANPSQSMMGTSQYSMATDPMSGNIAQRMAIGGPTKKKRAPLTSDRNLSAMDPYEAGLANLNNARYGANMAGITNPSAMTRLGEIPTAAGGGLSHLGGYSDGGRMLKGPGDGMSDNIPAMIGSKQPARLADGEFVVPADVVSHLGNGSTDAGAKKLYAMMDKVRRARTGKKKQAPAVNTGRLMPA